MWLFSSLFAAAANGFGFGMGVIGLTLMAAFWVVGALTAIASAMLVYLVARQLLASAGNHVCERMVAANPTRDDVLDRLQHARQAVCYAMAASMRKGGNHEGMLNPLQDELGEISEYIGVGSFRVAYAAAGSLHSRARAVERAILDGHAALLCA